MFNGVLLFVNHIQGCDADAKEIGAPRIAYCCLTCWGLGSRARRTSPFDGLSRRIISDRYTVGSACFHVQLLIHIRGEREKLYKPNRVAC